MGVTRTPRARRSAPKLPLALTGTPGTGKSRTARELASRWKVIEVSDLAVLRRAGRRRGRSTEVDVPALRRSLRSRPGPDLLVGHLAHLLTVSGAIVLRCQPVVLRRRLGRARRGTPRDRQANFVVEAVDLILREAREAGLPVWELDTTGRRPREVAREVERILVSRPPPRSAGVAWLSDPAVTAHLLDRPR
jgi:adenylate kinase